MKYRKKPVVIEAVELRWDNWSNEMCDFAGVGKLTDGKPEGTFLDKDNKPTKECSANTTIGMLIPTLEGVMVARQGDFIIRGVNGELYPCKPDIFEKTYEKVEDTPNGR
jgi:hypothetical protein